MNIQITPPGFGTPTIFYPGEPGWRLVLNACQLGITTVNNCLEKCPTLPDGIYGVQYSVAPNAKVYVEYNYLRIVCAMNRRNELLCQLNLPCCLPTKEEEYQIKLLDLIKNYLISAQTNVNELGNPEDAINQYRFAVSMMDKMTTRKPFC